MDKLAGIAIGDDPILKKVVETRSEFQQVDWTEHVADWMDSSIEGGSFDGIDASLYAGTGLVEDIKSCRNVGDLVVFIDTSGSVVDDDPIVTSALDQLEGLMNNIRAKSVRVVHADNTVRWTKNCERVTLSTESCAEDGGLNSSPRSIGYRRTSLTPPE